MNLKRLFSLLLVLSMLLSLAACGGSGEEVASDIPNGDFELEHEEGKWTGWAHTVGLARKLWLSDDGTDLKMSTIDALQTLEDEVLIDETNLTLAQANEKLSGVAGDMYYLRLVIDAKDATSFGINLKQGGKWDCTTYSYDVAQAIITGKTANKGEGASTSVTSGALSLVDGKLTMEIYVDRSLVEAFFNDAKSLSIRAYTEEEDSYGIDLFAEGDILIEELYVASMGSIFECRKKV